MNRFNFILLFFVMFALSFSQGKSSSNKSINLEIDKYLDKSFNYINTNLDSALYYANKSDKLIETYPSESKKFKLYKNYGVIYLAKGNYSISMNYLYKAKEINEVALSNDSKNLIFNENHVDLLIQLGVSNFYQFNYDEAFKYLHQAMNYLDKSVIDSPKTVSTIKIRIYNNIASIYSQKKEYNKALEFYKKASQLNLKIKNVINESSLTNNIGICYLEKKEYDLSLIYFEESLKIREKLNDNRGIAQCYNNIGKNYVLTNNFTKSYEYLDKALQLGREIGNTESIKNSLQTLTLLYEKSKNYEKAYETSIKYSQLKDSLFNGETIKRIAQIEMNHKFKTQKKLHELELKKKEVEKHKSELIYLIIGGSMFFLLAIAILLIFLQKSKIKNMNLFNTSLELNQINTNLEKEKLKEELDFKNRELTTKMMYLLKKNELIESVSSKLSTLKKISNLGNQKLIQEIIFEINTKKDKDVWSEFETHFTAVHTDFYTKLNNQFPNLTQNEKKLCAFLKLNMNSKDISAITFQSINSITVSRARLRKKLNIVGDDTNLSNFLNNL